jgi:hypothetical protein
VGWIKKKSGAVSQGILTAPARKIGLYETKRFIRVTVSAIGGMKSCTTMKIFFDAMHV